MDQLQSKLNQKQNQLKPQNQVLQFQEMYDLALEIKEQQEIIHKHKSQLISVMNNLNIHASLISEMESLVKHESDTQNILKQLQQLSQTVCLSEQETKLLKDQNNLKKNQQQMGFTVFVKLLKKIEIFEALKEVQILKETTDISKQDAPTNINTINTINQPKPSSWWNISGYFSSEKVSKLLN